MKTLKKGYTNGGMRTRSIISQLLLVVDYSNLHENKVKT